MLRRRTDRWISLVLAVGVSGCHHYGAPQATEQFVTQESYPADFTAPKDIVQVEDTVAPPASEPAGRERFSVPRELPGAEAPPIQLPAFDRSQTLAERRSSLESLFPEIPQAEGLTEPAVESVTLGELQDWALSYSPAVRQAAADVEKARGLAVQAGLYPNPTIGYEGDTLGTARTAGYNGLMVSQEFVTAGKLSLAQSSAMMEMRAAEQDLRKARIGLACDVRRGYFNVLIAQEQLRYSESLARLTEAAYHAHIDLVAGGEVAAYEPLQLRVIALQSRNSVITARNNVEAQWRQLASTVGTPDMARHQVLGSAEMPVPDINYQAAMAFLLSRHTDLAAATNRITGKGYNLELQEVTPIPNILVYGAFQHDATTPLSDYSTNIQIGLPVPIFNRNEGNISAAHAELVRANQDWYAARNELTSSLAEAYNRYATNKVVADSYRSDILQDQVRVYRGVYQQFLAAGDSSDFAQVVVAQQTLAAAINQYLDSLRQEWQATVDLAELLQVEDLFTMEELVGSATYHEDESPTPGSADLPAAPMPAQD